MDKKIIHTDIITDYEVLSENGWNDIKAIHETIEYQVYIVKTELCKLRCADRHIVISCNGHEIFVKDLKLGDIIKTINGLEMVSEIIITDELEHMYDLELTEESNSLYYTNDILSHNTFYLRQLLKELTKTDKKILYFSPAMIHSITDPSFINFISTWANDDRKGILLIEDAEPLLESRDNTRNMGVTNLLNLTDGLLNDVLGIQIICTFNTNLSNLDKALLREERLLARKEFRTLSLEQGLELANYLNIEDKKIKNDMTLAQIYSLKKDNEILIHDIKPEKLIGFGSKK